MFLDHEPSYLRNFYIYDRFHDTLVAIQVHTRFRSNPTIHLWLTSDNSLIAPECRICNSLGNCAGTSPLCIITFLVEYGSSLPFPRICHCNLVGRSAMGVNVNTPEPMCPLIQLEDQLVVSPDKIRLPSADLMKVCQRTYWQERSTLPVFLA